MEKKLTDVEIKLKELEDVIVSIIEKYNISKEDSLKLGLALSGVAIVMPEGSFHDE